MKTIVYLVSTLGRSGPTNQLYGLVKYLDRNVFDPYVITLSPEPHDSRLEDFKDLGVDVQSLFLSRIEALFDGMPKLKEKIEHIKPDVVHSSGIRADTFSSLLTIAYSTISTIRNYPYSDYTMRYGYLAGRIMAQWHLNIFKKLQKAVVVSRTNRELIAVKHGCDFEYIQNGIDDKLFMPPTREHKHLIREKLGMPKEKSIFISVGWLSRLKDPQTMIDGFLAINDDNAILLFVGSGPIENKIRSEYADFSDRIKFIGRISNVVDYLQASDYYISASLSEGLPNSVMEALGCGLPCILSDIMPHQEILSFDEKAGTFFRAGDSSSCCSAIKSVLKKDYEEMSRSARKIIEHHLSAKIMSEKYQKLYREL